MKKRILLFVCVCLAAVTVSAQSGSYKTVNIYDRIRFKGVTVTGISNDTTLSGLGESKLPTEFAVKGYVDNRIANISLEIGHTFVVPSQASMLALVASVGDVTVIPDSSKSYILKVLPASTFSNWVQIVTPGQVISAFGRTGTITAQAGDYNYSQIAGTPTIPSQFNPTAGTNMSLSGAYPNIQFNNTYTYTLPDITDYRNYTHPTNVTVDTKGRVVSISEGVDSNFFTRNERATGARDHDFANYPMTIHALRRANFRSDTFLILPGNFSEIRVNAYKVGAPDVMGVLVQYAYGWSNDFDGLDARAPSGAFYINRMLNKYVIERRNVIQENIVDTIPLGLARIGATHSDGSYYLEILPKKFPGSLRLYDRYLGTYSAVSSTDTTRYYYTVSGTGSLGARFDILLSKPLGTKVIIPFLDSLKTTPTQILVMDGDTVKRAPYTAITSGTGSGKVYAGEGMINVNDSTLRVDSTKYVTAYQLGLKLNTSVAASTYEPIFSKGTAFNKNFGATSGTVVEGNDSRMASIPGKLDKSDSTIAARVTALDSRTSNVPNVDATNPSNIVQSATYRFVSDAEKSTWNAKADASSLSGYVPNSGSSTIAGSKTFSSPLEINQAGVGVVTVGGSGMYANRSVYYLTNSYSTGITVFGGDVLSFRKGDNATKQLELTGGNAYLYNKLNLYNIATGVATDSVLVKNAGVVKQIAASTFLTSVPAQTWSSITSKPTTIAAYGITDYNSLGDARWSGLAHTHAFSALTSKPTTISGYGITDLSSLGDARWSALAHTHAFSALTSKPTTIAGYGITDAVALARFTDSIAALSARTFDVKLDTATGIKYDTTNHKLYNDTTLLATKAGLSTINGQSLSTGLDIVISGGGGSLPDDIPTYATQAAAVTGGLINKSLFKLPPNSNGNRLLAIVDTSLGFNYTVNNTGLGLAASVTLSTLTDSVFTMLIDWGDGTTVNYSTPSNSFTPTHSYATGGTYNVRIEVDNPYKTFNVSIEGYDINNVIYFRNVEYFKSVKSFLAGANTLRSDSVTVMKFPDVKSGVSQTLDFSYGGLTKFNPTTNISPRLYFFNISGNELNVTEVNNFLVWLNGQTINAGEKFLYMKQATAAAPTGLGATALTALEGKGWVIDHD